MEYGVRIQGSRHGGNARLDPEPAPSLDFAARCITSKRPPVGKRAAGVDPDHPVYAILR
jgi:hypothetical protein